MSPEQAIDSGEVDHRADIYSLGCTLYFLLTGRAPYKARSVMAIMLEHRDSPIPLVRDARPDTPPELETVFRRMVAKVPENRYQTMTDVVRELERIRSSDSPGSPAAGARPPQPATPVGPPGRSVGFDPAATGALGKTVGFEASSTDPAPPEADRVVGLAVVLVEPSRTQAGIIRRYLEQVGAGAVHTTGSGREALASAKRERARVIVSSMHLADMTGVQLARAMLGDPACEGIGFVLATSEADAQEPGAIPDSPRVVLMPKPFDPQRLARAIASVVT
jgi:CheY-like chemotaxis protein